jgi:hypothetical protein
MCEAPPPPLQQGVLLTGDSFWTTFHAAIEARRCLLLKEIEPF